MPSTDDRGPAQAPQVPGFDDLEEVYRPKNDPLADHSMLFTLLDNAVEKDSEEWRREDKIFDQFARLPGVILANNKEDLMDICFVSRSSSKRTTTEGDRRPDESQQGESAVPTWENKRQKKMPASDAGNIAE